MKRTVFVFGAGSTACLDIPTTKEQDRLFSMLDNKNDLLKNLKAIMDNNFGEDNYTVNDIFNLIDSNLLLHNGLYCEKNKIEFFELEECKKEVIRSLFAHFLDVIQKNQKSEKASETYNKYLRFYYELAKKELEYTLKNGIQENERSTFISRYSIVNFNWDLYSLLPIFEANAKLNHESGHYFPIQRNPNLRVFTDFNCEYASKGKANEVWYPFTEPAAHAVNSEKYSSSRRVLLTKCYYPHGAMNLFKCPSCAKHSYFLGDLTLKGVAESLSFENAEKATELCKCPYCSSVIRNYDFDILPQSNFKTRNSYLESVRLSMISELRQAKRLIFIGYSMPNDDVDYITMFKSLRQNVEEVFVVLYDKNAENKFVPYANLSKDSQNKVGNFHRAFDEKATYNFAGFPNAVDEILKKVE